MGVCTVRNAPWLVGQLLGWFELQSWAAQHGAVYIADRCTAESRYSTVQHIPLYQQQGKDVVLPSCGLGGSGGPRQDPGREQHPRTQGMTP